MIDVGQLLDDVSADSPCGENLEYDLLFGEMGRAAVGKAEQQFGDTIVPAEEPKWKDVQKLALELSGRTKDLRVAVELARAELALAGFASFSRVLELIRGYIERYWDTVHPQLDPDDDLDPTIRVNTLESLCDEEKTLRAVRTIPLVSSRTFGKFSIRDVAVADGELPPLSDDENKPDWTKINAAFEECETDELKESSGAVRSAIDHAGAIQRALNERVAAGNGVNLSSLISLLQSADRIYADQLAKRGLSLDSDSAPAEYAAINGVSDDGHSGMSAPRLSGRITTREDVLLALDKITEYYGQYEPSSPLPLLLLRCKRLVTASFLEIIADLLPDALEKINDVSGQRQS